MTRIKLRDFRTEEQEREFYRSRYPQGYKHQVWPDHVERVTASIHMINAWQSAVEGNPTIRTAADLSCGDASIVRGLVPSPSKIYLGDLTGHHANAEVWTKHMLDHPETFPLDLEFVPAGPLQDTLTELPDYGVDLFILSETLEHVDDPEGLLRHIAYKAKAIFISTPLQEKPETGNPEHYWSWGAEDINEMLEGTGWDPVGVQVLQPLSTRHMANAYTYQLWLAVRSD